jgi:hypothetical protein
MRYKSIFSVLVLLVSSIMLLANVMASPGPPVWVAQATISFPDSIPGEDPEISRYAADLVVVWEEGNLPNRDIWMKYSNFNGALGTWIFSPIPPAASLNDESNPAVAMSRVHPSTGPEIHVVYQLLNPSGINQIWHTWTLFWGAVWVPPRLMSSPSLNAIDPAIVYTESLTNPGAGNPGMLMQIVWAEETSSGSGLYQIQYDAFYWDPFLAPPRGYVSALNIGGVFPPTPIGVTTVSAAPTGGTCMFPEIASVDEFSPFRIVLIDYDFSVVWQETTTAGQWNIFYNDGTTITSPAISSNVGIAASGQINPTTTTDDCYAPDIAASQDYVWPGETHYFHVNWRRLDTSNGNQYIESCYAVGAGPTPGAGALLAAPTPPSAQGPTTSRLHNPTIATKLTALGPSVFETWMAWEDSTIVGANNPDIWYRVGACTVGLPPFAYTWGPGRVGYAPPAGGGSIEYNPELWNRNDWLTPFPTLTHLTFDQTILLTGATEVEYIDP